MKESESEVTQSCPTLCEPMECSLPDSSVHGIFQARVLERVAISVSRGSSQFRDGTLVSCIASRCFYHLSHQGRCFFDKLISLINWKLHVRNFPDTHPSNQSLKSLFLTLYYILNLPSDFTSADNHLIYVLLLEKSILRMTF